MNAAKLLVLLSSLFVLAAPNAVALAADGSAKPGRTTATKKEKWVQLFNGKNLSGWTPKFKGHKLGVNFNDTFRVEDGVLKVSYDRWTKPFAGDFGHLAYKKPFSKYRLRIEYRFVGDQVPGGEGWAVRNAGVMIHGQPPKTMGVDQRFPTSIEVQFLGGLNKGARSTANLCSPGTHVVMNGKLEKKHCVSSKSKTYDGDQWVTVEVEANGSGEIKHIVDGETVLSYTEPQYDDADEDAKAFIKGDKKLIDRGYLYLQAESHPVEYRKVEILELK